MINCWCVEHRKNQNALMEKYGLVARCEYICAECEKKEKWKKVDSTTRFKLLSVNELLKSEPDNIEDYGRITAGLQIGVEAIPMDETK